jgi:hypothetical protein
MLAVSVVALALGPLIAYRERRRNEAREVIQAAEAAYQVAVLTREVAEIAVRQFEKETYFQELQFIESEIARTNAEIDQLRRSDDASLSRRIRQKGYALFVSEPSGQLALEKARSLLEQAKTKKRILETITGPRTLRALQSEVVRTKAGEAAAQGMCDMLKARLASSWLLR